MRTTAVVTTLALSGCATAESKIVVDATTQDHKCLAQAIYYEAGHEPTVGQYAVGHVVLNRTRSSQFPNKICDVVYQRHPRNKKCHFGWACRSNPTPPKGIAWERSQQVATKILTETTPDVSRGALFFDQNHKIKNMDKVVTIGNHTFWNPKQKKVAKQQENKNEK
jgi:spore germination cell wall hydrolase CwlJ-like protein